MRRPLILAAGAAALAAEVALAINGHAAAQAAAGWQREFQNGMARVLRGLRAGDSDGMAGLLGLCFGYGFVHAVGPGHGKFLIGAYGASRPVGFGRLAGATVAASLGQAVTAVLLVLSGIGLFDLTRQQMTALAEGALTRISLVSIAGVGVFLLARAWGARGG